MVLHIRRKCDSGRSESCYINVSATTVNAHCLVHARSLSYFLLPCHLMPESFEGMRSILLLC